MKRITLLLLLLTMITGARLLPAGTESNSNFDMLKSLVGDWKGKGSEGKAVQVSYKLVSGGTVLMETIMADNEDMISMYAPDGNAVVMTHYCMANNQPRMRAAAAGPGSKSIAFSYLDATNLPGPDAGHMHKLVVTFVDNDHITQEWTWREKGQEKPETFQLERKKS